MQLAIAAAGFTPGEADALRRAMGAWKRSGGIEHFREKLIDGMRARGYAEEFAQRLYQQMMGFGEYGFPECVVGETRVVDADTGKWLTIDEIVSGSARIKTTLACDEELRLRKRAVVAVRPSGKKPVWHLKTALGHSIVATAEHPFMTLSGWRHLGKLRAGDHVAVARTLRLSLRRRWPRHKVLVLADGAREKHLPAEVFELCDANIALLLARLWERDGGFSARGHASYDTASSRLAREVQHLLLRLGIISRVYRRLRTYRGRRIDHYVVTVTGEDPLQRFWHHIGRRFFDLEKRQRSEALCLRSSELSHLANSDIYWDRIVEIKAVGKRETYDLQIEKNHNFLANNFVVHNSHSASFALLAYDSAWLKHHEPAAFTAALLNSQPMGFYAPAQLVRDARAHGVEVRPVDVCVSVWDCTLERGEDDRPAMRLGLRLVKSLSRSGADRLVEARLRQPFASVQDLAARAALDRGDLEALAAAGAFASLSGNRHLAFWEVAGTERPLPMEEVLSDAPHEVRHEPTPLLRTPTEGERIVADYASIGLTLGRHPLALLRDSLQSNRLLSARDLDGIAHGKPVRTAGIVLMRQRPGTASGVTFLTLEDETGQVNIIVWERIGEKYRGPLVDSRLLEVHGELQRQEGVMHVVARRLIDRSLLLGQLITRSRDFH